MNTRFGEFLPVGWTLGIDPVLWSEYLVAYLGTEQAELPAAGPLSTSSTVPRSLDRNVESDNNTTRPAREPLPGLR